MTVVDADGHVEESPAMFEYLDKECYPRRPLAVPLGRDTAYGDWNAVWLIDGKTYPQIVGRGGSRFRTPTSMEGARTKSVSIPAQELTDVPARLQDLAAMRIDQQVIYPTMFLTTTTDDVVLEAALMRAYNDFLADACQQSGGKLHFAAVVPVRDGAEAAGEVRRARELGAVAVMTLGVAWDKHLNHPSLYPFYEAAADAGLPVAIHFGWGCPGLSDTFTGLDPVSPFNGASLPVLMGFKSIMSGGIMARFPQLKVAFLEAGSAWLPWTIQQVRRDGSCDRDPADYFHEGRAYISCEMDEDLNYLVSCIGEDAIVVASDYPHADPSREEHMVDAVMSREDVPLRMREKVLGANPLALYNLRA
jgi:uncharacterized protein